MLDRREVMKAAWQRFRVTYRYPEIHSFMAIGRRCFASCLRNAWRAAKEAARKSALTVAQIAARISEISGELLANEYRRWTPELSAECSGLRAESKDLETRLAA
jgi:hypothetical protein